MMFGRLLPHYVPVAGALLSLSFLLQRGETSGSGVSAHADSAAEELQQNRQLLDRYRKNEPGRYARLQRDLRQFLDLAPERQARLREIDRQVHEQGASSAYRLLQATALYVDWLDRLSPKDRQRIERAPDRDSRIALIREMRQQEWIHRLPQALQKEIEQAPMETRQGLIAKLRLAERERRAQWRVVIRHWEDAVVRGRSQPMRLEDLPPNVKQFVEQVLLPMLTEEEKTRLSKAEGHWPDYPRTLVELADRHPVRLPGPPRGGPRTWAELPKELRSRLPPYFRTDPPPAVKKAEGKWPDYLMALAEWSARNKGRMGSQLVLPPRFCPSRPEDFALPIRQFIEKRLFPLLTPVEKKQLQEAEGQWPLYPQLVSELARKHGLRVPGMTLPGPPGWWDSYRTS